ncbi:MAG: hypothetical protein KDA17_01050 [Candidatus Saccharibacteria bacterium]|nr:hypothetical protein [Candidatus Saccharibacteria bacterium]MCA9339480.1 hypothetical protein [Candidatus Saccharibacteria bacterium]
MYRGSNPRIFPIIIVVLVIALVIAAVFSVGRMIFFSNSSSQDKATDSISSSLVDTDEGRSVRWAVRGPIVANEKFQSYQITVSPTSRSYTVYTGYLDQVVLTHRYENNRQAYEQFVYALAKADVTNTRNAADNDIRGACATQGLAFVFETAKDGTADQSEWTTTCAGSKGTMTAKPAQVQALFVNQIPDFSPIFDEIY